MKRGNADPASPRRIETTERRDKAVQLRLAGATFNQIAEQCGYTDRSSAYRAIRTAVDRVGREHAEELFDTNMARLDRLLMAVWQQAMQGEDKAVQNALRIIQQQARMLGYDATTIHTQGDAAAVADSRSSTLADLLGTDAGEMEQRMARVLHEGMPRVIDSTDTDTDGGGGDGG